MKVWVAGEVLTAADLNANFTEVGSLSGTAEQDLTAGNLVGPVFETANYYAKAFSAYYDNTTGITLTLNAVSVIAVPGADDKFIMAYTDAATTIKVVVGTVNRSTRTISWGTPVTASSAAVVSSVKYWQLMPVASGKIALAYVNSADQTQGKLIAATISGTVPTFGSAVTFYDHASSNLISVSGCQITTDKVALAWDHADASVFCGASSFSGTVITAGTAAALNANLYNGGNGQFVVSPATDKFVVWGGTYVQCGTVATLTITLGTQVDTALSSSHTNTDMVTHTTDAFIVTNSSSAKVCTIATRTITVNALQSSVGAGILRVVSSTDIRRYGTSNCYAWTISGSTITTVTTANIGVNTAMTQDSCRTGGGVITTNNGYWLFFNPSSSTNLRATIQGFSLGFCGFVNTTVSRAATITVDVFQNSSQSGLIPGAKYNLSTDVPAALQIAAESALDTTRELALFIATSTTKLVKV